VADLRDPFTASTLQIGGYHSYQHRGTFQWKGQYENAALDTG